MPRPVRVDEEGRRYIMNGNGRRLYKGVVVAVGERPRIKERFIKMDRLSELGTARGHAQRYVDIAKAELARAEAEYVARDIAYQRFIAERAEGD